MYYDVGDADAFYAYYDVIDAYEIYEVTPYCSQRCQRRDWTARHQAVCHNLARLQSGANGQDNTDAGDSSIPPPAPLRRPHSPARSGKKEPMKQEDTGFDRQNEKVFTPPGQVKQPQRNSNNNNRGGGRPNNFNRDNNRDNRDNNNYKKSYERRPQPKPAAEEEEWGIPNRPETTEPKPTAPKQPSAEPKTPTSQSTEPKPSPVPKSQPSVNIKPDPVQKPQQEAKSTTPLAVANTPRNDVKPASVSDVTPAKKLVPKNYVIETLPIGATALLSVDNVTSSCASKQPGFVCLSMCESVQEDYQALCETYVVDCEADKTSCKPSAGDMFSYLSPEDGGWYRARHLGNDTAALIDSSKLVTLAPTDSCKPLAPRYEAMPEYCCVLDASDVKVGDNLQCTLVAKTATGYKVTLTNVDTGAIVGEGSVCRWLPVVQYPPPPAAAPAAFVIPEVPRPDVIDNSKVILVDATALDKAFVRPADAASVRQHDQLLQDVYMHAAKASPLSSPPTKGDTVIGKFTDGCYYRALCKRTNVAQNKYLLEYIDFGNIEIAKLENLYACPAQYGLAAQPTMTSLVTLQASCGPALTPQATTYLEGLKETEEMMLTLASGAARAPSGAAVTLTVLKTNESLNRRLEQYCTPEWKKLDDVIESPKLMFESMSCVELPSGPCELEVVEFSAVQNGVVSGRPRGSGADAALAQLAQRMAAYCDSELGRQPYLPALEELCIAKCPPFEQWFRGVVVEHAPGDASARVLYVDYGNMESVPVSLLRKMLPEFAQLPAQATHLEIRDFPRDATDEQLALALTHMGVSEEQERGVLKVTSCTRTEAGLYVVTAPDLLRAMQV